MLRLSLNLASTRLILSRGHEGTAAAGHVIEAFGNFVMGGNFVIGIIVFAILVIVNFVVITKGSGRIAEVAARFHLDAMPGKQMAIDADLSAGLIDEKTAKDRRKALEDESGFFGAMDGASKFVRGDAVAGLLVVFINIIGGIIIGVAQQSLEFRRSRAHLHAAHRRRRPGHPGAGADRLHRRGPVGVESRRQRCCRQGADEAAVRLSAGARHVGRRDAGAGAAAGHSDAAVPRAGRRRRRAGLLGAQAQPRHLGRRSACGRSASGSRRGHCGGGRADRHRAEDRRPQDRTRLCAAAAGQRSRRHRPPHRADQGAAPQPRDRDGIRDALGAHPRQCAAGGQHLCHQDQGSRRRHRAHLAEPVHGHGSRRQSGQRPRPAHHRADVWIARDLGRCGD